MESDQNHLSLKKGTYLAPKYSVCIQENLSVGITEYPEAAETGLWHFHERSLLSFVLKGKNLENRANNQINRVPGSITFYHSYEPHQNIYYQFPSKHISVEIEGSFYKKYNLTETEIKLAVSVNPNAPFLFCKILKELMINDELTQICLEALLLDLICNSPKVENNDIEWISRVRNLLQDNWNINTSLDQLAYHACVHPVTISKNFRRHFTCTLGEYIRKLKVKRAMDLLVSGNNNLTDTAYRCGFADQSHFTRTFKSETGFLPRDYKKL